MAVSDPGLRYVPLPDRGLLVASGPDARSLVQGVVTNDVGKVGPGRAVYAALLTAQGKVLHDFFLAEVAGLGGPDSLVFDCEAARLPDLKRRLLMYRLRAKADFVEAPDHAVYALLPGAAACSAVGVAAEAGTARTLAGGAAFADPRLAAAGARALLPAAEAVAVLDGLGFAAADLAAYEEMRLTQGLPDGSRDIAIERNFPLECGFDELNAIDYKKGCYVGQELTARTHYRATIKKRLVPVRVDGPLPAPGTTVMLDGREAGEVRSGHGDLALALLRLQDLADAQPGSLMAGEARLTPRPPGWLRL